MDKEIKRILVTGGAGFIGSHTCVELLVSHYEVIILDNLSNSKLTAIERIKEISGKDVKFYRVDLTDEAGTKEVFAKEHIDTVIHFAGYKAVGESTQIPLEYYRNNVGGTLNLLKIMQQTGVKRLVFSSSATVYGNPESSPITEDSPLGAVNPYGRTKLFIEEILKDLYASDSEWRIVILRYFNPVGSHPSGRIGEDPQGIPNNLMPFIAQVAVGKLPKLRVFGNDYPTQDGTGVRDYIHVVDLAVGHLRALEKIAEQSGLYIYNLGTGKGHTVLEVVRAFEAVSGKKIPYEIVGRRPGDAAICFADPSKAERELNWKASRTLEEMCRDMWNWQMKNPLGYEE
ncbi:MAG: UDP-glucose 4-epimerase GalE [candidate division KSB1 bacterium]|nr:UDP-glucose 4-epimerase GalE [candidate division KSB1 bacterium]